MAEPTEAPMVPATRATTSNEVIRLDMSTVQGFEGLQRAAKMLCTSPLVPKDYQGPNGMASCAIALNLAARIGADPLMVMQNLYIVHGRPGWGAKFLISTFNNCGRFSSIRYEFVGTEGKDDWGCRAWSIEKATGQKIVGATVTIKLAKAEGWVDKSGSKWKTMPEQMLMYRAASWLINAYAPEVSMGLQTADEIEDIVTIDGTTGEVISGRGAAPRVVGSSAPEPGMPKALGEWSIDQLDELEELIEQIYKAMAGAGFKAEAEQFEADTRAKRAKAKPDELLAKLREDAAKMAAAAAQAQETKPDPAKRQRAAAKPAAEPQEEVGEWIITDEGGGVQAEYKDTTRSEAIEKVLHLLGKKELPQGWHVERIVQ